MAGSTTGHACTSCGAPLSPQGNSVRVLCGFCGATNDLASAGAVQVAKKLDQLGIRVPERPMTMDEIHEDLARREAARREERRTGIFITCAVFAIGLVILVVVLLAR